MSNTFGGFSSSPTILTFLQNNPMFVEIVRSYSVLLSANTSQSIINTARYQAYPRIGLILSSAKRLNNTYLFSSASDPSNTDQLYTNVVTLITSTSSPFSEGITRVAAALTASILIRQLPLNTDIKNIDLGDGIEKGALNDLQEIVKLYTQSGSSSNDNNQLNITNQSAIYFSLDIDKDTLPASYFNFNPLNTPIDFAVAHPNETVKIVRNIELPEDEIALCLYYITASNSGLLESGIFIHNGDTSLDIVENLADSINSSVISLGSNILASPNKGYDRLETLIIPKSRLYTSDVNDPNNYFSTKLMSFNVITNLDTIKFDARNFTALVNREVIIVRAYTFKRKEVAASKLSINPDTVNYRGQWVSGTTYSIGDLVTYPTRGVDYYCYANTADTQPPSQNTTAWTEIYNSPTSLIPYRKLPSTKDSIEGLVYGIVPSFPSLDKEGLCSVIVDMEQGSSKLLEDEDKKQDEIESNTFYFKLASGVPSINGRIEARISSDTGVVPVVVDLSNATEEDAALALLNALYAQSQNSEILGVLAHPNALQIVSFKKTLEEIKEVVDILSLPVGLEVATGIPSKVRTLYRNSPRSVVVKSEVKKETSADVLNKFSGSVNQASRLASTRIQTVYDKLSFLKKVSDRRHY